MISVRVVLVMCLATMTVAQIPSFGWCPEYASMADFDMNKYLGLWYESEKYFTMLEVGSRCVTTNYTQGLDGKFHVSNQITNRLTGIKRILDGELRSVGKAGEGKLTVKYNTLPVSFDTTFHVLETDYDNFAVLWSCSNLGPVKTQNAWVMTRERLAPGKVLQQAYGVLDKYKISRTFFVKTDQADCAILEANDAPVIAHAEEEVDTEEETAVRNVAPVVAAVEPAVVAPVHKPVHVAQVVDPTLHHHVKHDEVAEAVNEPSEAMLPPAPLEVIAPAMPEAVKAEIVEESVAPALQVEAIVPAVEAAAPVEPFVDAVKAEAAPVVEAVAPHVYVESAEPLVPQIPAKVLAAKSQIKKKVHA